MPAARVYPGMSNTCPHPISSYPGSALHSLPKILNLDYCGDSQPAGEESKEFFEFAPAEDTGLMVALGGVLGRGMPAAILLSGIRAWLRVLGGACSGVLSNAVEQLNRLVYEVAPEGFYGALFCARVDPVHRRLDYVNAGHEPALLVRANGQRVLPLENTGTLLGLTARAQHRHRSVTLEPGDVLLAFTEGISDACDGEAGVLRLLREYPYARAGDLVAHIMEASCGVPTPQDRTAAVVRFTAPAAMPLLLQDAVLAAA